MSDQIQLELDGCTIRPTNAVKLLGVTLDHHMTFGDKIDDVRSRCRALTDVLARSTPHLTVSLRRMFFTAMIRTHLEYCSAIFATASATKLK